MKTRGLADSHGAGAGQINETPTTVKINDPTLEAEKEKEHGKSVSWCDLGKSGVRRKRLKLGT